MKLWFMKNIVASLATLFCLMILIQSCSKKSQDGFSNQNSPTQVLETTVVSGQSYTFNTGQPGTLTVSRQASHFQISQTGTNEYGLPIYNYSSTAGYLGGDEVALVYNPKIVAAENNSGCQGSHSNDASSTSIVIKLTVTK
jgi:hypothetical protein